MKEQKSVSSREMVMKLVAVGLMAALVFLGSKLGVDIPVGVGGKTHIHLGNVMCLLSALLFGGLAGGIASGTGSMIVDLLDPAWISGAPITFINKFLMGFTCGIVSTKTRGRLNETKSAVIAAIAGQLVYMVLYLGKSFISVMMLGGENALQTAATTMVTKGIASSINAIIAVVVAVPLSIAIRKALNRAGILKPILGGSKA